MNYVSVKLLSILSECEYHEMGDAGRWPLAARNLIVAYTSIIVPYLQD
jgi:hypothetical protein